MDKERPPVSFSDKRRTQLSDDEVPPAPVVDPLQEAQARVQELENQLLREAADYANYKQRLVREQTDLVERASLRVVEKLLPVVDDLERALQAAATHEGSDALIKGVELVHKQLHDVLMQEGLERVITEGAFDPHEHEAVSSVPGDVAEPTILEVVRPGYKLKGKTIRPALVHVSVPVEGAD